MICCCKDWKSFIRDYFEQDFLSLNIKCLLGSGLKSFFSQNIRNVLRMSCFYFWSSKYAWVLNILFLKYKKAPFPEIKEGSVSWNIKSFYGFLFLKYNEFSQGFRFSKYKKSFLLRKYKKFFRRFSFLKYKKFSWDG